MTLPLVSTTYTVERPTNLSGDSSEELDFVQVATGIAGDTVYPTGSESVVQGDRERVDARIYIDWQSFEVQQYDRFVDELTGDVWSVSFCRKRTGLSLEHWIVGVYAVAGVARGTRDL